jgi:hypothetical protein
MGRKVMPITDVISTAFRKEEIVLHLPNSLKEGAV